MNWQMENLETRRVETPVTPVLEGKEIVGRFRDEEMFRVAGDVSRAETRRKVLSALQEMLPHLPPEDAAEIAAQGIAADFAAPALAELVQTELAIKLVSNNQNEK